MAAAPGQGLLHGATPTPSGSCGPSSPDWLEEEVWLAGGGLPLCALSVTLPGGQPHPPGLPGFPHGFRAHPGEDRGTFCSLRKGPRWWSSGRPPPSSLPVDPGGEVPGEAGPPAPGPAHPHPGGAGSRSGPRWPPPGWTRWCPPGSPSPEPGGRPDPGRPGGGEPPPLRQGRQRWWRQGMCSPAGAWASVSSRNWGGTSKRGRLILALERYL